MAAGCGVKGTVVIAPPTKAAKSDSGEPAHALRDEAKAVPPGKAIIRLVQSQPAGDKTEAEYEWVILTRLRFPDAAKAEPTNPEPGWVVARLIVKPYYLPAGDDNEHLGMREWKAKPGVRNVGYRTEATAWYSLPGNPDGLSRGELTLLAGCRQPGKPLVFARTIKPAAFFFAETENPNGSYEEEAIVEVPKQKLDDLAVLLLKESKTVELPAALDLLRTGDRITTLKIGK